MWIVRRDPAALAALPRGGRPSARPDHSIVVPAMSEYIRFAGAVPAMPTIDRADGGERLVDGERLVEAALAAEHDAPLWCLCYCDGPPAEADAERFSPARAEQRAPSARLVRFVVALPPRHEAAFAGAWPVAPEPAGERSWGWRDDAGLPDPGSWILELERFARQAAAIEAVNGRRPPWV